MRHSAGAWSGKRPRSPLSQWMLMRKLCRGIRLQSGMHFPVEPRLGNDVPFA